jgi:hypothetical protein
MINLFSIAKEWARDPALMGALEPVVAVAVTVALLTVGIGAIGTGAYWLEKKRVSAVVLGAASVCTFFALGLFVFTFAYAHHYGEGRFACPTFETQRYVIERGE